MITAIYQDRIVKGYNEFLPECDGEYAKDPVIPASFVEMLENDADIPVIIGHTTEESLLSFTGIVIVFFFKLGQIMNFFSPLLSLC